MNNIPSLQSFENTSRFYCDIQLIADQVERDLWRQPYSHLRATNPDSRRLKSVFTGIYTAVQDNFKLKQFS